MQALIRYCVGIDVSKDTLQLCLSGIDQMGHVSVKATTKVDNKPAGFSQLIAWVSRHRKLDLPMSYVMESTGVYHEALAWQLHQLDALVSILLPNKAKHYLQSLAGAPGRLQAVRRCGPKTIRLMLRASPAWAWSNS